MSPTNIERIPCWHFNSDSRSTGGSVGCSVDHHFAERDVNDGHDEWYLHMMLRGAQEHCFHLLTCSKLSSRSFLTRSSSTYTARTIPTQYSQPSMPRIVAPPPPSGEFQVKLQKSFGEWMLIYLSQKKRGALNADLVSDTPKLTVEVLGEPNRSAVVRQTRYDGNNKSSEKTGDVPASVQLLLTLERTILTTPSVMT